ncbi:MAG TPA: amino acid adenylation domain-containing protein [Azospirillum sp.]|nr:amino acid adenylation domain-containing protein [Azospirillum sp.]
MSDTSSRIKELSPAQRDLLLRRLARTGRAGQTRPAALTPAAGGLAEAPLSFAQERQWFLDRLAPGDPAHIITGALRLTGGLSEPALRHAFDAIVARHAVLRAGFQAPSGKPVQVIAPPGPLPIATVDLSAHPPAEREAACRALYDEEARRGFDLARDRLLRVTLVRLAEEEHFLVFTMHHIVSDGWSIGVLLEEIARFYTAFALGREPDLPALPVQYPDFAGWQRQRMEDGLIERGLAYWRGQLANPPPVLELAPDRLAHADGAAERDLSGAACERVIGRELKQALDELSRREDCTLYVTLLTGFMALLSRLSGREDILVGSPVSGRIRVETEALIGLFLNTLALRAQLPAGLPFREALGRVRTSFLAGLEHHEVPFERVVQDIDPERSANSHPLFEIFFNFTPAPPRTLALPGLRADFEAPASPRSEFSMVLYVTEWDGRLELKLQYQSARYSQRRMALLLEQLETLLAQAVADPGRPLGRFDLATPGAPLPDPAAPLERPEQEPVTSLIAGWAERTPDAPALRQGDLALTYAQLDARVAAVARRLLAEGLRAGEAVAVAGPRCSGFIVAMAGVLCAGGVMLTLSPDLPEQRRRAMLEQAGARFLLDAGEAGAGTGLARIAVTADGRVEDAAGAVVLPEPRAGLRDPAYLFFTSGSTGVPKGVRGTHGGLAHFLAWQRRAFGVGPGDRCAQLTGLSFDVVLRDVFLPLTSGAELVLPGEDESLSSGRTLEWLEAQRITLIHTVPSVVESWLIDPPGVTLAALKRAFFAGEPLTAALVERWRAAFPRAGEIVNLYGPTETTLAKFFYRVPPAPRAGVQPLGSPLPQTQALVLTPDGRLCGIGEPGEIAIRTPFRSLGYLDMPEETAKRFVANPLAGNPADPDDRIYRTGDRGMLGADGLLEFLGRMDHQVKIRGVRVEPMEVAAVLKDCPEVAACAVVTRDGGPDGVMLVAYVVARKEAGRSARRLREHLRPRLPAAMIPAAFVFLDALPLTANQKLDRSRLPPPGGGDGGGDGDGGDGDGGPVPPRDPVELQIAQIWQDLLGGKLPGGRTVGVTDSFFDLGGHSLLSLRLLMRIEQVTGRKVPLSALFEKPTVEHLANVVRRHDTAPSPVVRLWSAAGRQVLFLVHTGGGTILNYVPLVRHLAPALPVHAVQARGLDGREEPHRDVPAMAADYVERLRALQPQGPYLLGGHSFGGVIAYEMARQLTARGERVALLALFDSALARPEEQGEDQPDAAATAAALADATAIFSRYTGRDIAVSAQALAALPVDQQVARVSEAFRMSGGGSFADGEDMIRNLLAVGHAHREARRRYRPPPCPVPVTLFRATDTALTRGGAEDCLGWSAVAGPVRVLWSPGDHVTMMAERNAPALAAALRPILADAGGD